MVGNVTVQQTSGGCNVTSCSYDGFVNGTIITAYVYTFISSCDLQYDPFFWTCLCVVCMLIQSFYPPCRLSASLQPRCPGKILNA